MALPHIGTSLHSRPATVWSRSWWRLSVPDDQCLCRVSFNPLRCCIPRGASLCTPPRCCAAPRSGNKTPSWNRSWCPRYVGDGEKLDIRRLRQEYCSAPARLPGEVLSEIIGSCCGSYSAYLYRVRESRRADSNRLPLLQLRVIIVVGHEVAEWCKIPANQD